MTKTPLSGPENGQDGQQWRSNASQWTVGVALSALQSPDSPACPIKASSLCHMTASNRSTRSIPSVYYTHVTAPLDMPH